LNFEQFIYDLVSMLQVAWFEYGPMIILHWLSC